MKQKDTEHITGLGRIVPFNQPLQDLRRLFILFLPGIYPGNGHLDPTGVIGDTFQPLQLGQGLFFLFPQQVDMDKGHTCFFVIRVTGNDFPVKPGRLSVTLLLQIKFSQLHLQLC